MTQQQTIHQQLTPLEKLRADKQRVEAACQMQTAKLNADFTYIHQHAHSLLLAGLTSLLFPDNKQRTAHKKSNSSATQVTQATSTPWHVSDYFTILQSLTPIVWDVAQPLIVNWGIRKMKGWVVQLFTRKRSSHSKN